ncbi:MAG TPA: SRPBCC family protein [Draconibacterium sp.]|nr:SRPBCC family protein [Draconibacterium sp.]
MTKQQDKTTITVKAIISAPASIVWKNWTTPVDIVNWNNASDDWHTPQAENNVCVGGTFNYRMEAKDGSMGFDFEGVYNNVILHRKIEYTINDGRKVKILFSESDNQTEVTETFEAEETNPVEMQQTGWQAILDNFKKYVEEKRHNPDYLVE